MSWDRRSCEAWTWMPAGAPRPCGSSWADRGARSPLLPTRPLNFPRCRRRVFRRLPVPPREAPGLPGGIARRTHLLRISSRLRWRCRLAKARPPRGCPAGCLEGCPEGCRSGRGWQAVLSPRCSLGRRRCRDGAWPPWCLCWVPWAFGGLQGAVVLVTLPAPGPAAARMPRSPSRLPDPGRRRVPTLRSPSRMLLPA